MPPGKSAKAVYDDGSSTNGDPTLTFYYDAESHEGEGTSVIPVPTDCEDGNSPFEAANNSKFVYFDENFKDFNTITSLRCWFKGFANLEYVRNIEFLNTKNVTTMFELFRGTSIHSLDLTLNDFSSLGYEYETGLDYTFANCTQLTTVKLSEKIKVDAHVDGTFFEDSSLTYVDASFLNFSYDNDDYDSRAFYRCNKLKTIVTKSE